MSNWSHGEGNRYVVRTVLDRNDKPSDLNDGATGDYIYLLQTRDRLDENSTASMIGNGSVIVVIAFAVISIGAVVAVYVVHKKRQAAVAVDEAKDSENEASE